MHRYLFLFLLSVVVNSKASAQERTTTILTYPLRFQAVGAPMVEVSALQGQTVLSVGGMGAVVVNRHFFFGGYGQSGHTIVLLSDTHPYQATLSQGGFVLGYSHKASKPVHLLTNARLGWASITVKEVSTQQSFEQNNFTITPSIGAEMNVTRLLRVQLMGGYRMSINAGLTQPGTLMPIDMNSLVGTLTLSFGLF